jgi:hypothetical protein
MRLINADKVKAESREHCKTCILNGTKQCKTCVINLICDRLDLQPTIQEVPHDDLISRKWLIDAIESRKTYLSYEDARDVIKLIKNAPTVCVDEQELCPSEEAWVSNGEIFKRAFGMYATELWTMSEADFLKWLNQQVPQFDEIPTFNRKELEKARDYWYSHLEVGNEEQNEAAWAAINAIKYCIEHSSGYQKGAEND